MSDGKRKQKMRSRKNNTATAAAFFPLFAILIQFNLLIYSKYAASALSVVRKFSRKRTVSKSALYVSEVHIPAYRTTKLPFILSNTNEDPHNSELSSLYSDEDSFSLIPYQNGHLLHKTNQPIFTRDECQMIIDEAERTCERIGWTTSRHGNYPTTDIPVVELTDTLTFLKSALHHRIYPLMRHQFRHYLPDGMKLRVADGFVVKYDAEGGQKELLPHRDGSVLSFNIALNPSDEYEGGGTWFHSLSDAVKIEQGQIVTHASALLHGGHGITSGKRYILVCFVILEGYDQWSMRFYNQVRNM